MKDYELTLLIQQRFSKGEIHDLCLSLGIGYENLAGDTVSAKARSLVEYCARRSLTSELMKAISSARDIVFTSNDLAEASMIDNSKERPSSVDWLKSVAGSMDSKEAERAAALELLKADNLPAGIKAALGFLVKHA